MDPINMSPALQYNSMSPNGSENTYVKPDFTEGSTTDPPRKKQKRNKPTLSCEECVERKTKVGLVQLIMCSAAWERAVERLEECVGNAHCWE
jgi:hypothetical protein